MDTARSDRLTLVNGAVFDGDDVVEDGVVHVHGGVVAHVGSGHSSESAHEPGDVLDLAGAMVVPGFFDIQVNGGAGVLFNDPPEVETLTKLTDAHRRYGTTAMLPTFMTGPASGMRRAAAAVDEVRRAGNAMVVGIHFEGPVISPEQAGTHDPSWITSYADDEVLEATLSADSPTLVTLAPECAGAEMITRLVDADVRVAAGHTQASFEQMIAAADAGLTGATHLWNAMRPITSRDPGTVGALLARDGLWCSLIADGKHVADETMKVSLACRGVDRTILITDAMPPSAGGPSHFRLGPYEIRVEDGRCVMPNGQLAGAALELIAAVRHVVDHVGVDLFDALRMASLVPAQAMGLDDELGRIATHRMARLAVIDDDLNVTATIVGRSVEKYDPDD